MSRNRLCWAGVGHVGLIVVEGHSMPGRFISPARAIRESCVEAWRESHLTVLDFQHHWHWVASKTQCRVAYMLSVLFWPTQFHTESQPRKIESWPSYYWQLQTLRSPSFSISSEYCEPWGILWYPWIANIQFGKHSVRFSLFSRLSQQTLQDSRLYKQRVIFQHALFKIPERWNEVMAEGELFLSISWPVLEPNLRIFHPLSAGLCPKHATFLCKSFFQFRNHYWKILWIPILQLCILASRANLDRSTGEWPNFVKHATR